MATYKKAFLRRYGILLGILLFVSLISISCTGSDKEVQTTSLARTAGNTSAPEPSTVHSQHSPTTQLARENPCAVKALVNPYHRERKVEPQLVTRPAGTKMYQGNSTELLLEGERLWNDRTLGSNRLSCGVCHLNNGNFNPSFATPYPHAVALVEQMAGLSQISLEEMVQFCLVQPMLAKPLPWNSRELAALTVYTEQVQSKFIQATVSRSGVLKPLVANPVNPCIREKK